MADTVVRQVLSRRLVKGLKAPGMLTKGPANVLRRWKWIAITVEAPKPSTPVDRNSDLQFNWSLTLCHGFYEGRIPNESGRWCNPAHVLRLIRGYQSKWKVDERQTKQAPPELLLWGRIAPMLSSETPQELATIIKQTPLSIPNIPNADETWVRSAVKHLQDIGRVRPMNLDEMFHDARFSADKIYQTRASGVPMGPMIRHYSISEQEARKISWLSKAPDEKAKLLVRNYTSGLRTLPADLSKYSQRNGWAKRSMSVSS